MLPVLFAAIVGFACFLIILGVGGMVSEHNAQTADAPSAQPSSPEALPTQRPTNAPTQETVGSEEPVLPDETDEPTATDPPQDLPSNPAVQTQTPTSTGADKPASGQASACTACSDTCANSTEPWPGGFDPAHSTDRTAGAANATARTTDTSPSANGESGRRGRKSIHILARQRGGGNVPRDSELR